MRKQLLYAIGWKQDPDGQPLHTFPRRTRIRFGLAFAVVFALVLTVVAQLLF